MINIFKSIAKNSFIYGFPVRLTEKEKLWNRLRIIRKEAIRTARGLPMYTSVEYMLRLSSIHKNRDYSTTLLHESIRKTIINSDNTLKTYLVHILNQI